MQELYLILLQNKDFLFFKKAQYLEKGYFNLAQFCDNDTMIG